MLITDNGGEFTEKAFECLMRNNEIDHRLTTPYHPQMNGMTERFNGTLQKLLLKLTGGEEMKWSCYLADALYACQITAGPAGLSLYCAVFGQKVRLPRATEGHKDEGDRLRDVRKKSEYGRRNRKAPKFTSRSLCNSPGDKS